MKLNQYFLAALFISLLYSYSCDKNKSGKKEKEHPKENVDGGSCSYKHTFYPVVITSLYCDEFDRCGMEMTRPSPWNDTIYYSQINNGFLYSDTIKARNLKIGDTITYEVMDIISGSCNPYIDVLRLDKYKEKK